MSDWNKFENYLRYEVTGYSGSDLVYQLSRMPAGDRVSSACLKMLAGDQIAVSLVDFSGKFFWLYFT